MIQWAEKVLWRFVQDMLSKCANPVCGANFHYLNVGKLFVIRARRSDGRHGLSSKSVQPFEPMRCFWLCSSCSQSLTIQPSGFGRARIAPARNSQRHDDSCPAVELASTGSDLEYSMKPLNAKLEALIKELEFLDRGGYRMAIGWMAPLIFEDSPICPKSPNESCPHTRCVLMDFVPEEKNAENIPCRHIPLNLSGETLHTLYNTATMDEIEVALRKWLRTEIDKLRREVATKLEP